jgi:hypothetical protein
MIPPPAMTMEQLRAFRELQDKAPRNAVLWREVVRRAGPASGLRPDVVPSATTFNFAMRAIGCPVRSDSNPLLHAAFDALEGWLAAGTDVAVVSSAGSGAPTSPWQAHQLNEALGAVIDAQAALEHAVRDIRAFQAASTIDDTTRLAAAAAHLSAAERWMSFAWRWLHTIRAQIALERITSNLKDPLP